MQMTKIQKIISLTIFALIIVGGIYMFSKKDNKSGDVVENANSSSTSQIIDDLRANNPDYKIEEVPIKTVKTPDLSRQVTFSKEVVLTDEVKNLVSKKILEYQSELRVNPSNLPVWINMGIYQKMAGDWEGARISWQYVADVTDKDFVALGNLGDLYAYHIKDKTKAEASYKSAIKRDPSQAYLYVHLAEVYRDVFLDISKAKSIIDEGLKALPNNSELLSFKANLK